MKSPLISTIAIAALLATPALKADVLDLQFAPDSSPTQSGFQQFDISNGTLSFAPTTTGDSTSSIGVTVGNSAAFLNRGNANGYFAGPYTSLYEAFTGAASGLTLALTGLNDSTTYSIEFQSFDRSDGFPGTYDFSVTDTTVGGTGNTANGSFYDDTFGSDPSSYDPSANLGPNVGETPAVLTFTTTSSGAASFSFGGDPRINGFELAAATTPEPSTLALLGLGLGAGALLLRRRFRVQS
jgi:hypothetical protein